MWSCYPFVFFYKTFQFYFNWIFRNKYISHIGLKQDEELGELEEVGELEELEEPGELGELEETKEPREPGELGDLEN